MVGPPGPSLVFLLIHFLHPVFVHLSHIPCREIRTQMVVPSSINYCNVFVDSGDPSAAFVSRCVTLPSSQNSTSPSSLKVPFLIISPRSRIKSSTVIDLFPNICNSQPQPALFPLKTHV